MGGTAEQSRQRIGQVSDLAAESGLTYRLDLARPVNSFDAHRLMHHAERNGRGEQVREALMHAYTAEGVILSDLAALARIAGENGLDSDEVLSMLKGTACADAVRADEDLARELGVSGVPTFAFGGRFAVAGAQPVEVFTDPLRQGWRDSAIAGG
ncbi:DsbA family oxidoreductase [Nonomuraea sp. NPDC002799]